ncbi:NAD(P)/FAD-dependent oxidoreductase [Pontibacter akesuensis]|uniref:Pyridine nucleotide-disulphide oxidoreductase n=1 Tax=Pontibacter akesuensis TaxID=388950 RepID=A0A1I7GS60_9BACT|nr:FAD/NAD(P)-binding oxidoreductase [Pontibacter akesuensis]GHA55349.1 NADH oxidase [Pontibacter akesuensis]SFU51288.1 Pyridine nucleotide-disulphide oxidoreductase [Pontibacter akesuensis]
MKETDATSNFCTTTPGRRIVIIGNGISGVTCARHIRKRDSQAHITIISGEAEHFFSRTALMYIFMGQLKYAHTKPYEDNFWEKNRLSLVHDWVTSINFEQKQLQLQQQEPLAYDILILALGSKPNMFNWPGQELQGVQGLYTYQDLETMNASTVNCQRAVVVGGGLIGIELAEMLLSRNIPVTFLVRESHFWGSILPKEESELVMRHMREHHIDLRVETELKEVLDDGSGRVRAVVTTAGEEIPCQFVGLGVGVHPNINLVKETQLEVNRGILVDQYFATNIANVFAIGDCVEYRVPLPNRRSVEQVWYTGRMHGETLAHNLTREPVKYNPGPWFNSAKFLDIEYQTYGMVPYRWEEPVQSFYWEHPGGNIAFRAVFNGNDKRLHGVNALGMRLRHEFFDKALRENWTVEEVLQDMRRANFDPEFYDKHEHSILQAYNQQFEANLQPKKKKKGLLAFLGSRTTR